MSFAPNEEQKILRENVETLYLIQDSAGFTAWEMEFIESMHDRRDMCFVSDKQKEALARMVEKYA